MGDTPDLGPCCCCGGAERVRNIVMLSPRASTRDGWGCLVCGLPPDGASYVCCDRCLESGGGL